VDVVILVLALPLCLWVASLWLLRGWRYFWRFFACNAVLLLGHLYLNIQVLDFGHDEYGLGRLIATGGTVVLHAGLGLLVAVAVRWRQHSGT
jgi:hypothetical protein